MSWRRRAVRRSHLLWALTLTVVAWAAALVAGGAYLWTHLEATLALNDQRATLRLAAGLPVLARLETPVRTRIDSRPLVAVPIDQTVALDLLSAIDGQAQVRGVLPVATRVRIDQQVEAHALVQAEVPLTSWLPRLKVQLPLRLTVPVHMTVPVQVQVPLEGPVRLSARLDGPLQVPIRSVLHLRVPLHADLAAQVIGQSSLTLLDARDDIELRVHAPGVSLPLREIGWCVQPKCPARPAASSPVP